MSCRNKNNIAKACNTKCCKKEEPKKKHNCCSGILALATFLLLGNH